jgi:opacity protein-like surface antigen
LIEERTMLKQRVVVPVLISVILTAASAATAVAQGGVGFGPQIGFFKAQSADQPRGMGGAVLRVKFSDVFGIEGSINYREERYGGGAVDVKTWPVMMTALVYPVPILYGALGAGWYNTSISYNVPPGLLAGAASVSSETKQQFGWHFGGGLELPLFSSVKLVGDIRYVFLNYNFKSFPGSNGVNSNFYVMSVSLLFGL